MLALKFDIYVFAVRIINGGIQLAEKNSDKSFNYRLDIYRHESIVCRDLFLRGNRIKESYIIA